MTGMRRRALSDSPTTAALVENGNEMIDSRHEILRSKLMALMAGAVAFAVAAIALAATASSASAAVEWTAVPYSAPTNMVPGERGAFMIDAGNVGDEVAQGWPTVEVDLPEDLTFHSHNNSGGFGWSCSAAGTPQTVTCNHPTAPFLNFLWTEPHTYVGFSSLPLYLKFKVEVAPDAPAGTRPVEIRLSGTGAATTTTIDYEVRIADQATEFGVVPGSFEAGAHDVTGDPFTQAGGHPYSASVAFTTSKRFVEQNFGNENDWHRVVEPVDSNKDIVVDLPAGFVGNPQAVPTCTKTDVDNSACPPATQIGVARIANVAGPMNQLPPIYNVVPSKDTPAQFAFDTGGGPVVMTPVLRSDGDWGLSIDQKNLTEANPLYHGEVTIWGVPADPSHDIQRCAIPSHVGDVCAGYAANGQTIVEGGHDPTPSPVPPRPLLTNPTECTGAPEVTEIHMASWENPASFELDGDPDLSDPNWKSYSAEAPPLTGCENLSFDPEISVVPTTTQADAPTGLDVEIKVPQNENPDGLATAHLKDASVTLPVGMAVNPSSADGLGSCSPAQIGLVSAPGAEPVFNKLAGSCPLSSKIGSVEVDTPLLADPLVGDVFVAQQGDNPFGSIFALYFEVEGPGLRIKLAGEVKPDPQTGQLQTTFLNNPQLPFESLTVRLKGGSRAPLVNPATCGSHTATSVLTPWSGTPPVSLSDSFTVACPGNAGGFDPGFSAGSANPVAGAFSPFALQVTRGGGKELGRINVSLPKGALAALKSVGVCSEAQLASAASKSGHATQAGAACPVSSQVGTATVGAGAGPSPFYPTLPGTNVSGRVFLTAPHTNTQFGLPGVRQAAYGLAIEVPAVAGPFDLGTVLVRAAIYVDPTTAQITVLSDTMPRILAGVPLNTRDVRVNIDRARFATTPTSCRASEVVGDIRAQDNTSVVREARYQVGDCAALPFRPRLALRLTGRKQTRTGKHPGVRAVVRQRGVGEAAIKHAEVRLPKSLALDPDNAQSLCEFEAGTKPDLESHCPKGSIVGRARATSPLLKRPLAGNVYFVKNVRRNARGNLIRTLPMIVAALRGEIAVNLKGESSTTRAGKLVNTFANVPDAPISQFNLNIAGGRNGILTVTRTTKARINLCTSRQTAEADLDGHNGKTHDTNIRIKTPCAKKSRQGSKSKRAKRKATAERR